MEWHYMYYIGMCCNFSFFFWIIKENLILLSYSLALKVLTLGCLSCSAQSITWSPTHGRPLVREMAKTTILRQLMLPPLSIPDYQKNGKKEHKESQRSEGIITHWWSQSCINKMLLREVACQFAMISDSKLHAQIHILALTMALYNMCQFINLYELPSVSWRLKSCWLYNRGLQKCLFYKIVIWIRLTLCRIYICPNQYLFTLHIKQSNTFQRTHLWGYYSSRGQGTNITSLTWINRK